MLKKIMFSIFAVLFIFIFSKPSFSNEEINKISFNSIQQNLPIINSVQQNSSAVFFDGHHPRHRGPFYFYYTQPIRFGYYGHRHREHERHERHERRERHEHHEKHHEKHRH